MGHNEAKRKLGLLFKITELIIAGLAWRICLASTVPMGPALPMARRLVME